MRGKLFRVLAVLSVLGLLLGSLQFVVASPALDRPTPGKFTPVAGYEGDVTGKTPVKAETSERVNVFVRLADAPLALYKGEVAGIAKVGLTANKKLDLASPQAKAYLNYLESKHVTFKNALAKAVPTAKVFGETKIATNGIAVNLARKDVAQLSKLPGVTRVIVDRKIPFDMDAANAVYQTTVLWTALGGQSNAGKGMKIAIVDSGVDPDGPMMDDTGFTAPVGYPRGDLRFTNNKLIVARSYPMPDGPTMTAQDEGGHGTHVAGIAAGSAVTTDFNGYAVAASGIAPGAYVMNYNTACDPASSCVIPVLLTFDDVILDDADVVNMSWGGLGGPYELDYWTEPMQSLLAAGILPVASAGNAGPASETSQRSPSGLPEVLSVGATDNARFLGDSEVAVTAPTPVPPGLASLAALEAAFSGPFETVGPARFTFVGLACSPLTVDLTGKIALISRGACTFVTKVGNARAAGAIAVVVYNNLVGGPPIVMGGTLVGSIPAVMVSNGDGLALQAFAAANPTAELRITAGMAVAMPLPTETMMSFSSRGPGSGFQIKPDLVAIGGSVLSQCQNNNPAGFACYAESGWSLMQGTSMSSPMVAGAAALLKQLHPDWTPAQIKSALMTTAKQEIFNDYAHTQAVGITVRGAGQIDLSKAGDPGLTFDYPSYSFGVINLANETGTAARSVTITATDVRTGGAGNRMYDLAVVELAGAPGQVSVAVTPSMLTFGAAGETRTFALNVTIAPTAPAGNYSGYVTISHGPHANHIVYWFRVINKNVTGDVLVVDDDRNAEEYGGTYDVSPYYADVLTNLGRTYTIWSTLSFGPPSVADMKKAKAVIWFTGLDFYLSTSSGGNGLPTLTNVELEAIHAYLKQGGRLLLTGQDAVAGTVYWSEGIGGMMYFDWLQDSLYDPTYEGLPAPRPSMTGLVNDPIAGGLTLDVSWARKADGNWPDGFGGEFYTDEALPILSQGAWPILTTQGVTGAYPLGSGVVGIRTAAQPTLDAPAAYPGRSVWLGFGLENVNNDTGFSTREQLLGNILTWLEDDLSVTLTATVAPVGQTTILTANATSTKGTPRNYLWDFGDGYERYPTTRNWVNHVYNHPGTYTAKVLVTDSLGHSAVASVAVTIVAPLPDLSTSTKTVNKATASPEEKLTYTLVIKNTGAAPATDPWISDPIPAGTEYVADSATGGAVYDAARKTVRWGGVRSLPVGAQHTISFQVRILSSTTVGSNVVNTATFRDAASNVSATASATTGVVPQPEITLLLTDDTYLNQWRPTTNYANDRLAVRSADVNVSLLKFDTTAIPAGALIKRANLRLWADARTNTGGMVAGIYPMLRPWVENQATWNLAATGTAWGAPGASGPTDRAATPVATTRLLGINRWYAWDLTSLVQDYVNGTATNYGVMLKYTSGDVMVAYTFGPSEYAFPELRPTITIRYVNP